MKLTENTKEILTEMLENNVFEPNTSDLHDSIRERAEAIIDLFEDCHDRKVSCFGENETIELSVFTQKSEGEEYTNSIWTVSKTNGNFSEI
jgi:hypothetical protein